MPEWIAVLALLGVYPILWWALPRVFPWIYERQLASMDTDRSEGRLADLAHRLSQARRLAKLRAESDVRRLTLVGLTPKSALALNDYDAMALALAARGFLSPEALSERARVALEVWDEIRRRLFKAARDAGELPRGQGKPDGYAPHWTLTVGELKGRPGEDAVAFHRLAGTFGDVDPELMRQELLSLWAPEPRATGPTPEVSRTGWESEKLWLLGLRAARQEAVRTLVAWYVRSGLAPDAESAFEALWRPNWAEHRFHRPLVDGWEVVTERQRSHSPYNPFFDPDLRRTASLYVREMHARIADSEQLGPRNEAVVRALRKLPWVVEKDATVVVGRARRGIVKGASISRFRKAAMLCAILSLTGLWMARAEVHHASGALASIMALVCFYGWAPVGIFCGYQAGVTVRRRSHLNWLGWLVGVAIACSVGVAIIWAGVSTPGVGWRLDRLSSAPDWASDY